MNTANVVTALCAVVVGATMVASERAVIPEQKKDRVVITYWEKWTNFEADAMRVVVDDFNASQDKIFVKYLSVSGVDQKTLLATASGIPPDLAGLFGPNLSLYAQYDALTDLTEFANQNGFSRDYYLPVYYDMCTAKGKLLAFPTTPATVGLHYNKKILRDGGFDPEKPPETLEQLDAMDNALRKKDGDKIKMAGFMPSEPGWWPWAWPYYFGGSLFDEKTGRVTANRPENARAYEWMAGYASRYGATAYSDYKSGFGQFDSPQNGFINEKLASVLQGVWMANFIQKHNAKMEWGFAPFPYPEDRPDVKNASMVDLDIIVIPRGAKHPKEALEFLKYLQSQGPMEKLCLGQKKFSPLAKQSPSFDVGHPNPFIKEFRQLAETGYVISPPKTPIWGQYQSELSALIDQMNLQKLHPRDAMQMLQKKVEPLQQEANEIARLRGEQK